MGVRDTQLIYPGSGVTPGPVQFLSKTHEDFSMSFMETVIETVPGSREEHPSLRYLISGVTGINTTPLTHVEERVCVCVVTSTCVVDDVLY